MLVSVLISVLVSAGRCGGQCYDSFEVRFFENQRQAKQNSVAILLEGLSANRSAVGARVELRTAEGSQWREVSGGFGHYGTQHDFWLMFGMGQYCEAEIFVHWPNGDPASADVSSYEIQANGRYSIKQGSGIALLEAFRE